MSYGKFGKVVRSALDRAPGSGTVQRLIDKARGSPTQADLDIKSIIESKDDIAGDISVAPIEEDARDLEELCNVSRLKPRHRDRLHGRLPANPTLGKAAGFNGAAYDTYHFRRRQFARYGAVTQIPPGKLWPTQDELADLQVRAGLQHVMTANGIHEEARKAKEADEKKEAEIRERDELVAANVLKIDTLKEQLYKEAVDIEKELDAAEEKRNKRIEQVRKFFSYTLNVKDPRFKEKMVEMIQSEKESQRKAAKASKKEKAQARKKAALEAA